MGLHYINRRINWPPTQTDSRTCDTIMHKPQQTVHFCANSTSQRQGYTATVATTPFGSWRQSRHQIG
jgi:hypothetical protein